MPRDILCVNSAVLRMAKAGGGEIYLADTGKVIWGMGLDQEKKRA